ncbi:MAG: BtpA/SgcQ family protein [Desulfurococcales archaeon]|nr:BtpA/SgcQ family protein [Desulfurococcales archaeon]
MVLVMGVCKPLIGVVHLPPLPGSPGYKRAPYPREHGRVWSFDEIVGYAIDEAKKYEEAGFDGVIVENYGDQPYKIDAGMGEVASISIIVKELKKEISIPVGLNILRNSGYEAVYAAILSGASFIRINNLCEVRVSPEGVLYPAAHGIARALMELDSYDIVEKGELVIFADVGVKHSYPIHCRYDIQETARECVERAGFRIGGLVVTGGRSGEEPGLGVAEDASIVARQLRVPLLVGSGISHDNLPIYWKYVDGFIVGTSTKIGGQVENPVSIEKARSLVELAKRYRRTSKC